MRSWRSWKTSMDESDQIGRPMPTSNPTLRRSRDACRPSDLGEATTGSQPPSDAARGWLEADAYQLVLVDICHLVVGWLPRLGGESHQTVVGVKVDLRPAVHRDKVV